MKVDLAAGFQRLDAFRAASGLSLLATELRTFLVVRFWHVPGMSSVVAANHLAFVKLASIRIWLRA
jgi:hypothetical protein